MAKAHDFCIIDYSTGIILYSTGMHLMRDAVRLQSQMSGALGAGRAPALPVGHARFVERHEVYLTRGTTFGGREEHFIISFT